MIVALLSTFTPEKRSRKQQSISLALTYMSLRVSKRLFSTEWFRIKRYDMKRVIKVIGLIMITTLIVSVADLIFDLNLKRYTTYIVFFIGTALNKIGDR